MALGVMVVAFVLWRWRVYCGYKAILEAKGLKCERAVSFLPLSAGLGDLSALGAPRHWRQSFGGTAGLVWDRLRTTAYAMQPPRMYRPAPPPLPRRGACTLPGRDSPAEHMGGRQRARSVGTGGVLDGVACLCTVSPITRAHACGKHCTWLSSGHLPAMPRHWLLGNLDQMKGTGLFDFLRRGMQLDSNAFGVWLGDTAMVSVVSPETIKVREHGVVVRSP